jgi:predicted ester cyclase
VPQTLDFIALRNIPLVGIMGKHAPGIADAAAVMRKVADAYGAAWRAHDVDGILAWHSADMVFHLHAPGFGEVTGLEALREQFVALFSAWPDLEFRTIRLTVATDSFTHEMKMSGTPAGAMPPGPDPHGPGAGRVEFDAVDVIAVANGAVVRKDTYIDSAGLAEQLAAIGHDGANVDLGSERAVLDE